MICTQTYQFFLPQINCVVTLSQKVSNTGKISNVTNLTRQGEMWWGNAFRDLMLKSFVIITEKQ